MEDFQQRFGELDPATGLYVFSATRQGTIVGILCLGALFGSLLVGVLADRLGRRLTIILAALSSVVGTTIEITSNHSWAQYAVGRLVSGLGIGALSVVVPMYQSESSPVAIRGILVSLYQLLVTLGLFTAEMVNFGTHVLPGSRAWRIPSALGAVWAVALGFGMLFLPESPRHSFRIGQEDKARVTIARIAGLAPFDLAVSAQLDEIRAKQAEETAGIAAGPAPTRRWCGGVAAVLAAPRMLRRLLLGLTLQAGQQLTGVNFFFYYGTSVFQATGRLPPDGYTTQVIFGGVNAFCSLLGLVVAARCRRRTALMAGAAAMAVCFFVFAFVGRSALQPQLDAVVAAAGAGGNKSTSVPSGGRAAVVAGDILVAFSCLFIVSFATTWGPLVWTVVAELYPARHRAGCMAVATAGNWLCNFLMSFCTRFVTDAIGHLYGLVFAACCTGLVAVVYFFVIESKDRSLEEIDTMYVEGVRPAASRRWAAGREEDSGLDVDKDSAAIELRDRRVRAS